MTMSRGLSLSIDWSTRYGNKQNGQKSHNNAEGSPYRSKAVGEHSRSHSRSGSQHKQSFDAPEGYGRSRDHSAGSLISKPDPSAWNSSVRSNSTDRGRTMQRRYEFIDSDGTAHAVLTPVQETAKNQNDNSNNRSAGNIGRESNMTTMTDLMQQCAEHPPPQLPARHNHQQHQADGAAGPSATQLSPPQPTTKHRPPPLNLKNPAFVGMVNRNTNRYKVEHIAIKSSKAEHFDLYSPSTGSLVYDDIEDVQNISPLNIPKCNGMGGANSLQAYTEWRENMKPIHTASQGSIRITVPTLQEDTFAVKRRIDEDSRPIVGYHTAQDTPVINHVRSRSALGIRENGDKEDGHRQFSGNSIYTASEYSAAMPPSRGSGIIRSATMNEVSRRDRQYSGGSDTKASENGAMMNNVAPHTEMVTPPSPYTPLTAFIMQASGAPAGVEQGAKTLFGEHGWLEDTAAVGAKKPKMEKTGGFMESLKRKAREIVRHTFPWLDLLLLECFLKLSSIGRQHIV
ncbi:hypothetical protein F4824DRAFT_322625 [Ustulina deusta]|nr:hypothetical protein F4824DRAFT_322625 [Ustulina deusta]